MSACRCGFVIALTVVSLKIPAAAQTAWAGYARDAQHSALSTIASQPINRILWHTPVDLHPQYSGSDLFIHYGSPLITAANTVIVPVKTGILERFRVEARRGTDGVRIWRRASDYKLPPHDWTPSFSPTLSPLDKLWYPGKGGTVLSRTLPDKRRGAKVQRVVFYGSSLYRTHRRNFAQNVFINTPLTADAAGTIYFGLQVVGSTPAGLVSGIARITDSGVGSWIGAAVAAADSAITKVAHNSAPALSPDGTKLYVAVSEGDGFGSAAGYLLELDSATLTPINKVRLTDAVSGLDAAIHDDGTSSPTVGPDGDVYFGVLENPFPSNHDRGWLLHFDASLNPKSFPGAFGWDDTASIVPAAMVPSYSGSSAYLLMSKYNNYAGIGGDGVNRLAVLDPNDSMSDPISGAIVMKEILTVTGVTPDPEFTGTFPNAVREWCINTAAVDPINKVILANSEDGKLYRWDMTTGTLSQTLVLTPGIGEAYTPTLIGPDGTVYAINNATLFAVGQ
ncbi:MAG TPA: hypothetical protein VMT89_04295 [Candidatus Acidoferrales bacterium]|nr:hypothetical protein [Candidatus Acidoferrales bacterium]